MKKSLDRLGRDLRRFAEFSWILNQHIRFSGPKKSSSYSSRIISLSFDGKTTTPSTVQRAKRMLESRYKVKVHDLGTCRFGSNEIRRQLVIAEI